MRISTKPVERIGRSFGSGGNTAVYPTRRRDWMWRAPDERHLAGDFGQVYGMDVAEGIIDYASIHMPGFLVTDGVTLPVPDQAVSAEFSVIVFLHFDRAEYGSGTFASAVEY